MRELQAAIVDHLRQAGVTHQRLEEACQAVPHVTWSRLPLYTEEALGEVALQPLLAVKTPLELGDFVGVYEEFVAGFAETRELRRQPQLAYLRKALEVPRTEASHLFGDGLPRRGRRPVNVVRTAQSIVALAALAGYTYGGEVTHGPATLLVSVGDMHFGIDNGRPATNLGAGRFLSHLAKVKHPAGLAMLGRDRGVWREPSGLTAYTQLAAWGRHNPKLVTPAWELALNTLRFWGHGYNPLRLLSGIARERDATLLRQALRLCRGYREFENPYAQLRLLLVPGCIDAEEFTDLFGVKPRGPITHHRWNQWDVALDHLNEKEFA